MGWIHQWSNLVLCFCLLENCLLQFQFMCLELVCSEFIFLPGSVLKGYTFLRICPFLPSCPFYWHIVLQSSLMIFCISVLCVMISPFSFLILLICLLPFFPDESGKRFVYFVYLLKEPAFSFINLYYCFFHFFFF